MWDVDCEAWAAAALRLLGSLDAFASEELSLDLLDGL